MVRALVGEGLGRGTSGGGGRGSHREINEAVGSAIKVDVGCFSWLPC